MWVDPTARCGCGFPVPLVEGAYVGGGVGVMVVVVEGSEKKDSCRPRGGKKDLEGNLGSSRTEEGGGRK